MTMKFSQSIDERRQTAIRRPAFHFTPPKGWMNDPNGLVYHDGEYHLFYQHHPHSLEFGAMHWGHAVSSDLVRWRHLTTALEPDALGLIYSGCVVFDRRNTSGFGRDGAPPLVAVFTYHDDEREAAGLSDSEYQALAYSLDRGRTWTKYGGNPVLRSPSGKADFRDPKVFWHDGSESWIMALAVRNRIEFFASQTLRTWRFLSAFEPPAGKEACVLECPDLFPLPINEGSGFAWVLIVSVNPGGPQGGSGTQYFIGDFDGSAFTLDPSFAETVLESGPQWLDWGGDNYAGVTWSDIPEADGRRLLIGWMSNWQWARTAPTADWRGAMTAPRELFLLGERERPRLGSRPVRELEPFFQIEQRLSPGADTQGRSAKEFCAAFAPGRARLATTTTVASTAKFGLQFANTSGERLRVGFDARKREYFFESFSCSEPNSEDATPVGYRSMPASGLNQVSEWTLLVDENAFELFAENGAAVMTETAYPRRRFDEVAYFCEGDGASLLHLELSRFVADD